MTASFERVIEEWVFGGLPTRLKISAVRDPVSLLQLTPDKL